MVSAPRRGWEGAESPGTVPHGTLRQPESLPSEAHRLFPGIVHALFTLGAWKEREMRARPLGTLGSQGITGKTPITARSHPVPALATWKMRKKKESICLFCRKCSKWGSLGTRGCHVTCFLNLGGVCVSVTLHTCKYGNALRWPSGTMARGCVHRTAMKGEKTLTAQQSVLSAA